jgi:acyl-CoA thioester hydrolase
VRGGAKAWTAVDVRCRHAKAVGERKASFISEFRLDIDVTDEEILADLLYPNAPSTAERWSMRRTVRWSDLDAIGHMRSSAHSDLAADARVAFLVERGFPLARLRDLGIAPVNLTERLTYRREALLGDELTVSVALAALSRDASRLTMENVIRKPDGETASIVAVEAAWLSLERRKLVTPGPELARELWSAPRAERFEVLQAEAPTR